MTSPVIEGWFTTGPEPALLGSRCEECGTVAFPPSESSCRNPVCGGEQAGRVPLSRRGKVWSYTDAQYQPPAPYVPATDPYEPFALAAVALPEGIVVLGQLATGCTVEDVRVGSEVELVVEPLDAENVVWKWRPVG